MKNKIFIEIHSLQNKHKVSILSLIVMFYEKKISYFHKVHLNLHLNITYSSELFKA